MNPVVRYYLHQAGRGYGGTEIVPIYSVPPFIQRGHRIGSVLTGFWRRINSIIWSGAKTLGRKSVRTGRKILADSAQDTNSDITPRDIVSKHLSESIGKLLSGRGRKWKRNINTARTNQETKKKKKKAQWAKKRYIFIEDTHPLPDCVCNIIMFVSCEFDIFASKSVQESVHETVDVVNKPIAPVDQSDLEFLIPADNETYWSRY